MLLHRCHVLLLLLHGRHVLLQLLLLLLLVLLLLLLLLLLLGIRGRARGWLRLRLAHLFWTVGW
jgi:hypothetical protein